MNANDELAQAQQQRDEYLDQLQRSRAEFANYQKRSKAQADADRVYAVGSLARDLLDGLDNLERAIEAPARVGAGRDHRGARHGPQATARAPWPSTASSRSPRSASRSTPTSTRPWSSSPTPTSPRGPSSPS